MAHQGALDLHRAQAVAAHIDHVIDPAHHPEVAVPIPAGAVAGEIEVGAVRRPDLLPVAAAEAVGVAVHRAHHPRPGPAHRQVATGIGGLRHAIVIDDVGGDARQGQGAGAGLGGGGAGQGADHHAAGLGLPPGIHHRAAVAADHIPIPHPGLGIDRLAHRAEDAQGAHVVLVGHLTAALHESPDRRGRRVKDRAAVLLDHLPEGTRLGGTGRTLIHHCGGAIGKGAVDDVAVAGDPAHIGRAPVDVVVLDVEDPLEGEVGPEVVAGGGVHHPLGLAGGAGGIEHKQPVLAGHRLGRAVGALGLHQPVPPVVAALLHGAVATGTIQPAHHQHGLHTRSPALGAESLVHRRLERHRLVLAEAAIGGDHGLGLAIDQPVAQGIGREAPEHHRVGGADAGAGQHGNGRLRHHRHIEGHQIALADPQRLERVGGPANLSMQLAVAEGARVARFALPDQGRLLGAGTVEVAVEAVEAQVGGAALKPAGEGRIAPVEHRVEGREPVQLLAGEIAPEAVGIGLRPAAELPVSLHRADAGTGRQGGGRHEQPLFLQHRLDRHGSGCCAVRRHGIRRRGLGHGSSGSGKVGPHSSWARVLQQGADP